MHNLDDYAWYEVGNQRYYNKMQALLEHQQSRQPIHWNVNDAEYDRYDWTREPEQSIEQLYAERAQDIRNRYDYLVLHFSGGTDSGNILEVFIRNRIHLDEILVRGSFSTVDPKTGVVSAVDQYSEVMVQSLPLAQWAKENHMPHVKISVVDTVDKVIDYYSRRRDWVETGTWASTPSQVVKANLDMLNPQYGRMAEAGLRVGHIVGVEKPHIFREKNYFYTRYMDTIYMDWVSPSETMDIRPQYTECFYWGKRAIPLQIKSLHMLKRYIKQNNLQNHEFDYTLGRDYDRLVAKVLYTRTMPVLLEHEKDSWTGIVKSRDSWFIKDRFHDAFVNYQRGIEYLGVLTDPNWFIDSNNFVGKGIKGIFSKTRFLGT